jgi:hypothetical protein
MNSLQRDRDRVPATSPATGTKRPRQAGRVYTSQKPLATIAAKKAKPQYVPTSSPESPPATKKRPRPSTHDQTTKPTLPASRTKSHTPKSSPSKQKRSAPGTPAAATPGTIKRFSTSAETVKPYDIVKKDGFKAFLKSIMEAFRIAAAGGKFKMPADHEVGPMVAKILEAVVSTFDLEVTYM